jgi:predicted nucleic acid-binding protein
MNVEKILIDTSVWIKYFRDKSAGLSKKVFVSPHLISYEC